MNNRLLSLELTTERDTVAARQRARQVGALLGCDAQDQIRIATAVSELARNALRYAGHGTIDFSVATAADGAANLQIEVRDKGPGIANVEQALLGHPQGAGESRLGLITAQRMMDSFSIDSRPGAGTTIILGKAIPHRAGPITSEKIAAVGRELSKHPVADPHAEIQQQNRELLRSLEELRLRQEDLTRLNAELEDTNRGVMALYAELDERATQLRAADETKTRFLSSVSHEFRTPVNSILALTQILLHRLDGALSVEQEKQVGYIRQAAEQLSTLIDDLLDLRKVESGKIQMRIESFGIVDLFGALRGMFKPLAKPGVALLIDEPAELPELHTDHGKLSQILRNLISNALKFTERGSVRVSARLANDGDNVVFDIVDTGIGIAPDNHRRIFEEFTQVENPLQSAVKGTGLGLPLSQRLAALIGGHITVRSALGEGSVFSLVIPRLIETDDASSEVATRTQAECVLIIDDNEMERYALRQFLALAEYDVMEAEGGYEGLRLARQHQPNFIFLDLSMPDIHGLEVLNLLRATDATRDIPVVIFTSFVPEDADRDKLSRADALLLKKNLSRDTVVSVLHRVRAQPRIDHESRA
ncbi:MAG: ATP-binding protein [Steroidobacter sp.]